MISLAGDLLCIDLPDFANDPMPISSQRFEGYVNLDNGGGSVAEMMILLFKIFGTSLITVHCDFRMIAEKARENAEQYRRKKYSAIRSLMQIH